MPKARSYRPTATALTIAPPNRRRQVEANGQAIVVRKMGHLRRAVTRGTRAVMDSAHAVTSSFRFGYTKKRFD